MRHRLVYLQIVPVMVVEDGDGNLAPGPEVRPLVVAAADLDQVAALVRAGVEEMNSNAPDRGPRGS